MAGVDRTENTGATTVMVALLSVIAILFLSSRIHRTLHYFFDSYFVINLNIKLVTIYDHG